MDVVLSRNSNGEADTNVPHSIKKYKEFSKPIAYEWGAKEPGAAELALNILLLFRDQFTSNRLHLKFMADIISDVPYSGGVLAKNDIEAWIAANERFEEVRKQTTYMVAVYREEAKANRIHEVKAFTEKEAVIKACEIYDVEEEYVKQLNNQLTSFDELYDYYASREIWFSEPIIKP